MSLPRATLRLQFHAGFTFDAAHARLDQWAELGISHVYASPICAAVPGSMHGYDQTDPTQINPELGGEAGLRRLCAGLRARGMGLVIDIVPNHMATGAHNPWWQDVLRFGVHSRHAHWFDIDWRAADPSLRGRLLLPVLGKQLGEVVADGELELVLDEARGEISIGYFDNRFPLGLASYGPVLRGVAAPPHLGARLAALADGFDAEADLADADPDDGDVVPAAIAAGFDRARRALLAALGDADVCAVLRAGLAAYGGPAGWPQRAAAWIDLLDAQPYRLAWWRAAPDEINWRRFFDVNSLVALSADRPEVFDAVHALPLRLVREGLVDGLRIDHIDGLTDPAGYCARLRAALDAAERARDVDVGAARAGGRTWLVVEKILAPGEPMPDWPVDGTSGYDFMAEVAGLLHAPEGESALTALWQEMSGRSRDFAVEKRCARAEILDLSFSAQFGGAVAALHRHARASAATRDWSAHAIARVLRALLLHFPVYRIYARIDGASDQDCAVLAQAVAAARAELRPAEHALLEVVAGWLAGGTAPERGRGNATAAGADSANPVLRPDGLRHAPGPHGGIGGRSANDDGSAGNHADAALAEALRRVQQLSAPLAAKAVEDTALYRYGRLLSRNDVGFEPEEFALSPAGFHACMQARAAHWPHAMLSTATHDHKRGEDVRARLAVLSEVPGAWAQAVGRWREMNRLSGARRDADAPSGGDEAMLYQTLVGAWSPGLESSDAAGLRAFAERVIGWQEKALREAKLRTEWIAPDPAYEAACRDFVLALLDPAQSATFLASVVDFVADIAPAGVVNSLVQLALRCTAPGVPDLYQGCDGWDFSLVDPDNRRPVDWDARAAMLDAAAPAHWPDAAIKQRLLRDLLALRARCADVFADGGYTPVEIDGPAAEQVLAFVRGTPARAVLVAVALRPMRSAPADASRLTLPARFAGLRWRGALSRVVATLIGAAPEMAGAATAPDAAMPAIDARDEGGSDLPTLDRLFGELPVAVFESVAQ